MSDVSEGVVLFGAGSPVVVDVEESLHRLGLRLVAAVRNVPGEVLLLDRAALVDVDDMPATLVQHPVLVPLFTPANREAAWAEARRRGFSRAATIVDPTAIVPRSIDYGDGVYINAGCTIGAAGRLGDFVFVNRGVVIGHHARLDAFVSIGPGVTLAGQVEIGRGTLVGVGAVVLPGIHVGANAIVGAGAVVTKDVPEGAVVIGSPARVVRSVAVPQSRPVS